MTAQLLPIEAPSRLRMAEPISLVLPVLPRDVAAAPGAGDGGEVDPSAEQAAAAAAEQTRDELHTHGVLAVRLVGPPGAGKTSLIVETVWRLRDQARVAVVVTNPAARRDAEQVARYVSRVTFIDTPVPTAAAVRQALGRIDLPQTDLVLVESCGGIAPFPDIGQDATVAVLSAAGGDDKAAEYAHLVGAASAVVLTGADLRRYVRFDPDVFRADVRRLNPSAGVFEVSATEGTGIPDWMTWLEARRVGKNSARRRRPDEDAAPECFLG